MQKKIILTDYAVPACMLALLGLLWPLSSWGSGTTVLVVALFVVISCLGVGYARRQRAKLNQAEQNTLDAVQCAEEQNQQFSQNHYEMEKELETLRTRVKTTESVKERFLANISHEIRTPMNGIFGMTDLLCQTQLNSNQRRYADTIKRSTESLLNIVNDILDFSKIQNGELELEYSHFHLGHLLEDVCDLYAEIAQKRGLEIICNVSSAGTAIVNGDSARVRQILDNLVSNAIKFTEGGEVVVSATAIEATNEFQLAVSDSGMGIAPEIQDHIFKEFTQADCSTTRRFGGTGLGLSIANKLVTLMGGKISLQSNPGGGSTFTFTGNLTLVGTTSEPVVHDQIDNIKALIVDDNTTNSAILTHQLELWGIEAHSVDSGRAALDLLQAAHQDKKPFNIAILDLHMPEMDGLELASHIQRNLNHASLKRMMLTSSLTNMTSDELQGIGISFALTKPARQSSLYKAIQDMIKPVVSVEPNPQQRLELRKTSKPKILLTEDNPINQEVACIMLESIGCEVEIAENGSEAVDALAAKQFDLIFMDCQMPVMDGFEATRTIRSQSSQNNIPVVALTANAMERDRELCIASGMDDYLSKPVKQNELQSTLEKWLYQRPVANTNNSPPPTPKEALETMNFEFDESALDAIKALQRPGKPDILARIVNMYLEKTPELITDIEQGVAANDAARVKMAAHTLKSSSAYLGATTLAAQCNTLEAKAANEDLSDSSTDVSIISSGFDELCLQIKKFA